ncbi:aldo/keto reductase [Gammaproteobacteria bacterium]|nr:aldo/keto reductase [Gammaproteobacteria bacterium]
MKLALGTAQFGMSYGIKNMTGQVSQHAVQQILQFASSIGMHTIDTAMAYGTSEQRLGLAGVSTFNLITKLPSLPENCDNIDDWMFSEVRGSLTRLNVKCLHGLMLHRPDQLYGRMGERILESLMSLKEAGLVKKVGVSVYDPGELDRLFSLADFGIVQCPLNLMDRRLVDSGWLQKLTLKSVEVHTRSSFLQGLLLMERGDIPKKFEIWKCYWDRWYEWVRDNNVTRLHGCLSYCLSHKDIDSVVVGVDKKSQLEEIVAASNNKVLDSFPDLSCSDENLINPAKW